MFVKLEYNRFYYPFRVKNGFKRHISVRVYNSITLCKMFLKNLTFTKKKSKMFLNILY